MGKYFVIDESVNHVSKAALNEIEGSKARVIRQHELDQNKLKSEILAAPNDIKCVDGRVVVACDIESKNWHTFENGTRIRRERQYENLNRRETEPVNAIVVHSNNIPQKSNILIHPNVIIESNRIYNYAPLSGKNEGSEIRYYSIPEEQCYAWHNGVEWQPLEGFAFALRVFKPYTGVIHGIEPTLIKNVLYLTTGELSGKVCHTLKACDYQIVFQDMNDQEGSIIRCRHFEGGEPHDREEIVAINNELTELVERGELFVGLTKSDAKAIKEIV